MARSICFSSKYAQKFKKYSFHLNFFKREREKVRSFRQFASTTESCLMIPKKLILLDERRPYANKKGQLAGGQKDK